MGNFIDKTFTVIADILLKLLPASKQEKQAFSYYRSGMTAQSKGNFVEAIDNYLKALELEEDPYDRSYIFYNLGIVYAKMGKYTAALNFYHEATLLQEDFNQALNNIGAIFFYEARQAQAANEPELAKELYDRAGEYFREACRISPDNYPNTINWLRVTGRMPNNENL